MDIDVTLSRLNEKRLIVVDWIGSDLTGGNDEHYAVLRAGYEKAGLKIGGCPKDFNGFHAMYNNLLRSEGLKEVSLLVGSKPKKKKTRQKRKRAKTFDTKRFYASYEWSKVRYKALKRDGEHCALCNAARRDGVQMHVDHIKPLRKYWELRLDINNLQVLCGNCNRGKGNWDETDWRPKDEIQAEKEWSENGKNPL